MMVPVVTANSCSLTVYRTWGTATFYPIHILVDEVEVGRLWSGQTLQVDVSAGSHNVQPRFPGSGLAGKAGKAVSARAALEVQASPGEQVNLQLGLNRLGVWEIRVAKPHDEPAARMLVSAPTSSAESMRMARDAPGLRASEVVCQISEGERFEVDLGDPEIRVIDNSSGVSDAVRTFRLCRTWSRTLTTDTERALRATVGLNIPWVLVKAEIDGALTQHLSRSFQEQQSFEDTVVITAAAHTKTTVFFAWKEIRQKGKVRVLVDGVAADVPFEAVIGLSFDQRQVDERGAYRPRP